MSKIVTRGRDASAPAPAVRQETLTERAARVKRERQAYLISAPGIADLHEALIDIHSVSKETRVNGAKKLAELKSAEAFSPLLEVLQKEKDPEARILLLKAIEATAAEPPFNPLFKTAKEPLRKIIFSGGDVKEAVQAIYAIQHCISDYRPDISEYMFSLSGELESKFTRNDSRPAIASRVASSIEED